MLPFCNAIKIGFVYDLGFLHFPDAYPRSVAIINRRTRELVHSADRIVVISESTKNDIMQVYHAKEQKIDVVYPSIDARFTPNGPVHKEQHPYILSVGSLKRGKDIPFALRVFKQFLESSQKQYTYLLVGGNYWEDPTIAKTIAKEDLADSVKITGFVSDDELPKYYRGAYALLITSLWEGFCLPAVEAISCGCPVVYRNAGSLPEIIGKHGRAFDTETQAVSALLYPKKSILQSPYHWSDFAKKIYALF